jgi:hypothetical protein
MSRFKSLLFVFALAVQLPLASATVTYAVGTCLPKLASFPTISDAVGASPAPNVVEVCPGTYQEQVIITVPMTVEGISFENSAQAMIAVPQPAGLVTNTNNDLFDPIAAQILVLSDGVTLRNLTVDGSNNFIGFGSFVVGVFYLASSGTMSQLTVQNQNGNFNGIGVYLEGSTNHPSVTLENSNVEGFDFGGVVMETNSTSSELTATIKGNDVATTSAASDANGITIAGGVTASVSDNLIVGAPLGVETGGFGAKTLSGSRGSVSKNTIVNNGTGILVGADGVSVTSNMIRNNGFGIVVISAVAPVTGNTISQSSYGINFECVALKNIHSNTIVDDATGLFNVPISAVTSNTYSNVGAIRGGGC